MLDLSRIYILAGGPAVGKSTTARALANQFHKSIHIPVDDIREMVVNGLVHPGSEWSGDLIDQLALARHSASQMALAYNQAGFAVVIDDFWDPNSRLMEYLSLFQEANVRKILIFPSQQTAEERNLKRSGSAAGAQYISEGIRFVYESLKTEIAALDRAGWIVLDTTDKNADTVVQEILTRTG